MAQQLPAMRHGKEARGARGEQYGCSKVPLDGGDETRAPSKSESPPGSSSRQSSGDEEGFRFFGGAPVVATSPPAAPGKLVHTAEFRRSRYLTRGASAKPRSFSNDEVSVAACSSQEAEEPLEENVLVQGPMQQNVFLGVWRWRWVVLTDKELRVYAGDGQGNVGEGLGELLSVISVEEGDLDFVNYTPPEFQFDEESSGTSVILRCGPGERVQEEVASSTLWRWSWEKARWALRQDRASKGLCAPGFMHWLLSKSLLAADDEAETTPSR
eukprot:TRINITY_DN30859_c0_g1_i1.p1 TRINITY_DN30859_c0_g1~~TRINITY_DN30859_c0_g1_i1.p1  ORF type:complete len:270 (-),score=67.74 TRINITY_DN30859_c0_g1_i1:333-1142(-)